MDERYIVKPVLGAMRVVEALSRAEHPLTLPEVAAKAGLSKTTAFRYLKTFELLGYAEAASNGAYSIGPAIYVLSTDDARERALRSISEDIMRALHSTFSETVNLAVPKGKRIHYIFILESRKPLRLRAETGDSECFHCTALGKAILAFMPPHRVDEHLNKPMLKLTDKTIVTRLKLDRALGEVRKFGYAIDREENELGCNCYAAPIIDPDGSPIAAISVSIPTPRLTDQLDLEIAESVRGAAGHISRHISVSRSDALKSAEIRSNRGRR